MVTCMLLHLLNIMLVVVPITLVLLHQFRIDRIVLAYVLLILRDSRGVWLTLFRRNKAITVQLLSAILATQALVWNLLNGAVRMIRVLLLTTTHVRLVLMWILLNERVSFICTTCVKEIQANITTRLLWYFSIRDTSNSCSILNTLDTVFSPCVALALISSIVISRTFPFASAFVPDVAVHAITDRSLLRIYGFRSNASSSYYFTTMSDIYSFSQVACRLVDVNSLIDINTIIWVRVTIVIPIWVRSENIWVDLGLLLSPTMSCCLN